MINKIDLPSARVEEARSQIEDVIGIPAKSAPAISAKDGTNIDQVLEQIIENFPSPKGDENAPLKALIFDSYYDNFKGAVCLVRIVDGSIRAGTRAKFFSTGKVYDVTEVGIFTPSEKETDCLLAGDVGYVCASIKNVRETKVGDTITEEGRPCAEALPGYKVIFIRPLVPYI